MLFNKNYLKRALLLLGGLVISLNTIGCTCNCKDNIKKTNIHSSILVLKVSPARLVGSEKTIEAIFTASGSKKPVDLKQYQLRISFTETGGTGSSLNYLDSTKVAKVIKSRLQESIGHFFSTTTLEPNGNSLKVSFTLASGVQVTSVAIKFELLDNKDQVSQSSIVNWKEGPAAAPQINISNLVYDPVNRQVIYEICNAESKEVQNVQLRYINISENASGKAVLIANKNQDTIHIETIAAKSSTGNYELPVNYHATTATFKFELLHEGKLLLKATKEIICPSTIPNFFLHSNDISLIGENREIKFNINVRNKNEEVDINKLSLSITQPIESPAKILYNGVPITKLKGAALEVGKDISLTITPETANKAAFKVQLLYNNIPSDTPLTFYWQNNTTHFQQMVGSPSFTQSIAAWEQLIEQEEDVNAPIYTNGYTALHVVSGTENIKTEDILRQANLIKLLVSKGADINSTNIDGWTPLHTAIDSWQKEVITELVANGANVNAKDRMLQTPLHRAVGASSDEVTSSLLQAPGIDIDAQDVNGSTPLHIAIRKAICSINPYSVINSESLNCIQLLLDHGARKDIQDSNQKTPLDLARESNIEQLKSYLVW